MISIQICFGFFELFNFAKPLTMVRVIHGSRHVHLIVCKPTYLL